MMLYLQCRVTPAHSSILQFPWVLSSTELSSLKNNNILSYGKIRGSFAQVGQAGTYNQKVYVQGGAGSGFLSDGIVYPLGGVSGFRPDRTLYDPNLKPQNTKNWEIGTELKFLNNRIGIDYTYSDQTATDQIFSVPMAGSTGYSSFVTNAGEMTSKAHELVLHVIPVSDQADSMGYKCELIQKSKTKLYHLLKVLKV